MELNSRSSTQYLEELRRFGLSGNYLVSTRGMDYWESPRFGSNLLAKAWHSRIRYRYTHKFSRFASYHIVYK